MGMLVGIMFPYTKTSVCVSTPITIQDQRFLDSMQEQVETGIKFNSLIRQHELDNLGANPHVTPTQMEAFTKSALELYEEK